MNRRVRLLLIRLTLALIICIAGPVRADQPADRETASERSAQILVMLYLPVPHLTPGMSYSGRYEDAVSKAARQRTARAIARRHNMRVTDSWPMPLIAVDCFVFDLPAGMSVTDAIAALSGERGVQWAEPMQIYRGRASPDNDPLYPAQPSASAWHLSDLHRIASGRGVRVAVIDSKVDSAHPDLAGQVSLSEDFVGGKVPMAEEHGTEVAGVIAAKANNGLGIAGIAPGARLMALRACWEHSAASAVTLCNTLSLARAIHFAIDHDAQVINLSLSGPSDLLLDKLIGIALERGVAVVAAYDPGAKRGGFPASRQGVVAVADESLRPWPAGVYGAPGRDIPTTQPGGRWYLVNGNSFAAAHVSGLLALVRQRTPHMAKHLVTAPGTGAIDACASVMPIERTCDCACAIQAAGQR